MSPSRSSFEIFEASLRQSAVSHLGLFSGWLAAEFLVYPKFESLKTRLHPRDGGVRPLIELEPTDLPLAVEQRQGIAVERVAEVYSANMHN